MIGEKLGERQNFIYYNDSFFSERIRFTILHEVAHILLGHKQQSDLAESEANFFAKYLLAPPVLIDEINPEDYIDVMDKFNITKTCAINCFNYYHKWKQISKQRINKYTPYEIKILRVFNGVLAYETA